MERTNPYVLKARNFWRENRRLVLLLLAAAVLGLIVAGLNTWNHRNSIERFQLQEPREINNTESVEFDFSVDNPALIGTATLTMDVSGEETPLEISVNGEQIQTVRTGSSTVSIPTEVLQQENRVSISRSELAFNTQTLEDANVVAFTNVQQLVFVGLNFAALLLIFLPLGAVKYREFQRRKEMEEEFPGFLRDVVEGARAGMSLPQAIQNTADSDYGELNPLIDKMASQIDWGIPFDEILEEFGRRSGSPMIQRSVDTITQAYTSGGDIEDVLESVGDNIRSIKQLKEERQSQLYGEMITGYVVYFIFIAILVALTNYLLPNLAQASESLTGTSTGLDLFGNLGGGNLRENISLYEQWFSRLVYIQALFSGLIIGKLSEGEMRAGLKHVAILFAIGYLATTFFL